MSAKLGELIAEAGYAEMYGVELSAPAEEYAHHHLLLLLPSSQRNELTADSKQNRGKPAPFSTLLILQKFLRANQGQVNKASEQLLGALKWRKEFKPLEVMKQVFDKTKFQGLGYVTRLKNVPGSPNDGDIATFNIYGAVKDTKKTFGDLDE